MYHIKLEVQDKNELIDLLKVQDDIVITIEKQFDKSLLKVIDDAILAKKKVKLIFILNEFTGLDLLKSVPNLQNLSVFSFEKPLDNIDIMQDFKILKSLDFFGGLTNKNLSFKPIEHIESLSQFAFENGLTKQYNFVNQQKGLEKLQANIIDLTLITVKEQLNTLRVESTLKAENLMPEKFPNLTNLHLHACSRLSNHTFLSGLKKIESINIGYNSKITQFPSIENPELVTTIEMFECPNFFSIDSLLQFKNLERLVLTSHNKPLQVTVKDFEKLTQLKKLKTVYTTWGKRSANDLEIISAIYTTTKWKNDSTIDT
jgi:hypothetical protein